MDAIGEAHGHTMIVFDNASRVTHNVGDASYITKGWTCGHPLKPYDMRPIGPGAQSGVFPDTSFGNFKPGWVLHNAGKAACSVTPYRDPLGNVLAGGVGYDLYGFSHDIPNGMCVQLLNTSCGVAKPAARYYGPYAAANAIYNAVYSNAVANRPWIFGALGICPGGSRYAANQVVNTMLYGDPWNTDATECNVAVSGVVTPVPNQIERRGFGCRHADCARLRRLPAKPTPLAAVSASRTAPSGKSANTKCDGRFFGNHPAAGVRAMRNGASPSGRRGSSGESDLYNSAIIGPQGGWRASYETTISILDSVLDCDSVHIHRSRLQRCTFTALTRAGAVLASRPATSFRHRRASTLRSQMLAGV